MLYVNDEQMVIFFGNANTAFDRHLLADMTAYQQNQKLKRFKQSLGVSSLICLDQVHSANSTIVDYSYPTYSIQADSLITQHIHLGLGVYTADCLPIVLYDPVHHVAGICHAGRVGSINLIGPKTLQRMSNIFKTNPAVVQVYFGPAAGACCYEINSHIAAQITDASLARMVVVRRGKALFLDLITYNRLLLQAVGVPEHNIDLSYTPCTICVDQFCSYRRQGPTVPRQLSVVCLK